MKRAYINVRDWLDGHFDGVTGAEASMFPLLPLGIAAAFFSKPIGPAEHFAFWFFVAVSIVWLTFALWRFYHYVMRIGRKSGRDYEKKDRYKLPPEYSDSEDALMAAERRNAKRRRK